MARYTYVIFTAAIAGRERDFNDWYDQQHLGDVIKIEGIVAARRFRSAGYGTAPAEYLTLYEFESDDVASVMAEIAARNGTDLMPVSDAVNIEATSSCLFEEIAARSEG